MVKEKKMRREEKFFVNSQMFCIALRNFFAFARKEHKTL